MSLRRDPEKQREWERRSRERAAAKQREKGRAPLKRKPMKRKPPAKRGRDRNGRAHDIIKQAVIDAQRRFKHAARDQRVCQCCGHGGSFDAHHVVEKAWLKANGFSEVEWYDPDNALRLCDEMNVNDCHGKHTRQIRPKHQLHLRCLRQENLDYAFRIMGARAGSYLRRKYRGEDPRLEALEQAHE